MNDSAVYSEIISFSVFYHSIHGYIAFPVSVFGVISNIVNVIILTQNNLQSATNFMLASVAMCHLVLNTTYLIYVIHQSILFPDLCDPQRQSYGWVVFTLIFAHSSFTIYGLSTWLTVDLAIVRCLQLQTREPKYTRISTARNITCGTTFVVLVLCAPNYLSFELKLEDIGEIPCEGAANLTGEIYFVIGESVLSEKLRNLPLRIAFWFSGVLFFLLPCTLLLVFGSYMLRILAEFRSRRKRLRRGQASQCCLVQQQNTILLTILAIFLSTQIPQGILTLLCAFLDKSYRFDVYQNLGELMELMSLINASASFILNCSMSSQFRETFLYVFCGLGSLPGNQESTTFFPRADSIFRSFRQSRKLTPNSEAGLPKVVLQMTGAHRVLSQPVMDAIELNLGSAL